MQCDRLYPHSITGPCSKCHQLEREQLQRKIIEMDSQIRYLRAKRVTAKQLLAQALEDFGLRLTRLAALLKG